MTNSTNPAEYWPEAIRNQIEAATAISVDLMTIRYKPFRSFIIELGSGHQILIDAESEILLPRNRPELVIAFTGNGLMHEFEAQAITRLIEAT